MSISRKQALTELHNMFPDYDKKALNTLLRANGIKYFVHKCYFLGNMLNATIDYIL